MTKDEFINKRKARPYRSRFARYSDPAYRDFQYDIFIGGDPQYQPATPKPYWNPEAPKARDHRYFAPI